MEAAHDTTFFKVLLIVLGATAIVIPLVQRLRLPPVVGYMAVGMAVGPFGVGTLVADIPFLAALVIDDHAAIVPVAELGVALLMFMIGLELSPERIWLMRRMVFGLGFAQLGSCALAIGLLVLGFGYGKPEAIVIGLALAMSSTAVVLQVLAEQKRLNSNSGRASFAVLLLQDLAVVLVLFALSSAGHRFAWISWQTVTILALGVASWWVLFLHEKRLAAPFFPIELLQMPAVRQWLRTAMLSTFCLLALIFYLPLYFQLGLHVDSATSGMLLTPVLLGFITGGALGGRRAGRTGDPKSIPIAGNALAAIAILALAFAPRHVALVAAVGFFAGLGLGPTMPLVQVVVQTVAGRQKLGAATSLTVLARTLGAALGTALVGAVIFSLLPDVDVVQLVRRTNPAAMPSDEVILRAFQAAFMVTAAVAAAASINAWRATRVKI